MRRLIYLLLIFVFIGCSDIPENVLSEDDMVDLLVDIHKGEAFVEINRNKYYNDSLKKTVRQSILLKHGVSEAEFDSSLVWYGYNINEYVELYDEVIAKLSEQDEEILAEAKKQGETVSVAAGDSVNMWMKSDLRVLSKLFGDTAISFNAVSDNNFKKGDNFVLQFRLHDSNVLARILIAVDYKDGKTEYIYREQTKEGWNRLRFQSDSTKEVNRVYSLVKFHLKEKETSFMDSIGFIRTRLNPQSYYYTIQQHGLKNKRH